MRDGFRRVNGQFRGFWAIDEDSIEEGCFFSFLHVVIISSCRGEIFEYSEVCRNLDGLFERLWGEWVKLGERIENMKLC